MCYFSDEEKRKAMRGTFSAQDIEQIAGGLFHRALKLQIGCGAEPAIYKDLPAIVRVGSKYKVPYISLTTNGSLLTRERLMELAEAGLHEITISAHGTLKETYEYFMENGKFSDFERLLRDFIPLKAAYPTLKIRLNYTMNEDNIEELSRFWKTFEGIPIDILQLRPIQEIGHSAYHNFNLGKIHDLFDRVITPLVASCRERGVMCLYPEKQNLVMLEKETEDTGLDLENFTYCYVSPRGCWESDFDFHTDTFETYSKRTGLARKILRTAFKRRKTSRQKGNLTRKMNYTID